MVKNRECICTTHLVNIALCVREVLADFSLASEKVVNEEAKVSDSEKGVINICACFTSVHNIATYVYCRCVHYAGSGRQLPYPINIQLYNALCFGLSTANLTAAVSVLSWLASFICCREANR